MGDIEAMTAPKNQPVPDVPAEKPATCGACSRYDSQVCRMEIEKRYADEPGAAVRVSG